MCGRYAVTLPPEKFRQFFQYAEQPNFPPRYNIAPTQPVAVVVQDHSVRHFRLMRWGFLPEWVKDPSQFPLVINARADSLRAKPSFKAAVKHRRCIFLADGFYEWRREGAVKQPFLFRMRSREPMPIAGLWETYADPDGGEMDTVAIITTEANGLMSDIHHRMPVILGQKGIERWLSTGVYSVREALEEARACPDEWLDCVPVSPRLNNAAIDEASLQQEIDLKEVIKKQLPLQGSLF